MNLRLGIDLGGTDVKIGLVDGRYQLPYKTSIPTPDAFDLAVEKTADAALRFLHSAGIRPEGLPFAGIGVPSTVHPRTGRIVLANNKGWENAPLKEAMQARLQMPVLLANDTDCALSGEAAAGAAKGLANVLMLTLGTGVGGAVLLKGQLFSGADGMGMELGHTPLAAGGRPCTCGAEGCLEAYASATGLIALTRETMAASPDSLMHRAAAEDDDQVTGKTAFECAKAGDKAALHVIDTYCGLLAQGIGGMVNIFRPERVLIGGGVSLAGEPLFSRLNALVPRFILAYGSIGGPDILPALLGNDAGIIGAAYLDRVQGRNDAHV